MQGWFGVFDFDLNHGRVVHDYLAAAAAEVGLPFARTRARNRGRRGLTPCYTLT